MVPPAQCDIWLARPVRPRDLADEAARRLLRLQGVVHRQIYSTSLHCTSHEHHASCFRLVNGTTRRAVRPCATLCDRSELYCGRPRLLYRMLSYAYIRGHTRMCICGCILTYIYDYIFELGTRVFLLSLIHILSINVDGILLVSCIVCKYGSLRALLPTIFD